jgi:RNA polymerase sigma factor (sigma-70 family)
MFIDLVGIGKQQINYPDASDCEFATTKEYIKMAKKLVSKFGPTFGPNITKEILASDDAISNIATHLMLADWRWKEKYENEQKTVRAKYSYRTQCGIWAIKGYMNRKTKSKETPVRSLNATYGDSETQIIKFIEDKKAAVYATSYEDEEHKKFVNDKLNALLGSGILTEKEQDYITKHYLEQLTMPEIAAKNSISREAVRQVINRGISKLQELVNS